MAIFLSIRIGVLIDRFGPRKVTLFFVRAAGPGAVVSLVPWFWSLLVLRLVDGARCHSIGPGLRHSSRSSPQARRAILGGLPFRPTGLDNCADARRRGVGFRRHLASYLIGVVWGGVLSSPCCIPPEAEFFASPHEEGAARAHSAPPIFGPGFQIFGPR